MEDHYTATGAQRMEAFELAKRKLEGNALIEAKMFIFGKRRSNRDINGLIARLSGKPDVSVPDEHRRRVGIRESSEGEQIRSERARGDSLREIARRHKVSVSTVWRACGAEGSAL